MIRFLLDRVKRDYISNFEENFDSKLLDIDLIPIWDMIDAYIVCRISEIYTL